MPLHEEFVRSGNWLFRWRSYLPLLIVGLVIYSLKDFTYPRGSETLEALWEVLCFLVSFCGLAIRIYTVGHAAAGTSGRNTKVQEAAVLNTTGIYSLMRHPLYVGNFVVALGFVLFTRDPWLMIVYTLAYSLYYERIMFAEEEYLREKFGSQYLEWAQRTPACLPRPGTWRPPSLSFSVRFALRREYNGFFTIIVTMSGLHAIGTFFATGRIGLNAGYVILLSVGLVIWMTLRTLKRKTVLLDTVGR